MAAQRATEAARAITVREAWDVVVEERCQIWSGNHDQDRIRRAKAGGVPVKRGSRGRGLTVDGPLDPLMERKPEELTLEAHSSCDRCGRHRLAGIAVDLEAAGAPARVAAVNGDCAVIGPERRLRGALDRNKPASAIEPTPGSLMQLVERARNPPFFRPRILAAVGAPLAPELSLLEPRAGRHSLLASHQPGPSPNKQRYSPQARRAPSPCTWSSCPRPSHASS